MLTRPRWTPACSGFARWEVVPSQIYLVNERLTKVDHTQKLLYHLHNPISHITVQAMKVSIPAQGEVTMRSLGPVTFSPTLRSLGNLVKCRVEPRCILLR